MVDSRDQSEADEASTLARHRAALEAGAGPTIVTGWIAEEITAMVQQLGDIIGVLREADLADWTEVNQQLGLRLTYHPDEPKVRVQSSLSAHPCG